MKKLRFLPLLLTVILSSCVADNFGDKNTDAEGEAFIKFSLAVDDGFNAGQTKVDEPADKLDPALVPEADSLYVDLYKFGYRTSDARKETWNRIYFGKYEDAKARTFNVNGGLFKLLTFHGDSTACGFNKPYFMAEEEFNVESQQLKEVSLTAKVSNVRISVNFDETVSGSYYDYFLRFANIDTVAAPVVHKKYKQILRYKKDESRDAYMMPTDSLQIQFMAQYEYGDEESWKYVTLDTIAVAGNDHLTVNVSVTDPRYGLLGVEIITDDNIVKKEEEVDILEAWAPQPAPQVIAAGFPNNEHAVIEGDNTGNGATVSILAKGGVKNLFFTVTSDYLASAGFDLPLGTEIDLADSNMDPTIKSKLKAAGFDWQDDILGTRKLTYIKMTDFFAQVNSLNPSLDVKRDIAAFTIRVVDEVDQEALLNLNSACHPITQELSIPDGNVWARKIVSPLLVAPYGVSRLFKLQVSTDGQIWEDYASFSSANGSKIDFGTLAVNSDTRYYFRTMYNSNPNLVSNVVEVLTEKELQVGNSGFEEYHTAIMHVSPLGWIYDYDREWYLPYNEGDTNPWWAVNSKSTMPDGHTAWTSNFCKNFPCTAFSTNSHSGDKSAMVYTVNVGDANTDATAVGTSVPGEIWIGRSDDNGNHVKDGRSFSSRPLSVKFWYKYDPINNENFVVDVVLTDASGNEIARSEKHDGMSSAEWKQCEIPVVYSELQSKAASLYICFKSCIGGGVNIQSQAEIAGIQQTAHIGSVLRIDDIELTY